MLRACYAQLPPPLHGRFSIHQPRAAEAHLQEAHLRSCVHAGRVLIFKPTPRASRLRDVDDPWMWLRGQSRIFVVGIRLMMVAKRQAQPCVRYGRGRSWTNTNTNTNTHKGGLMADDEGAHVPRRRPKRKRPTAAWLGAG